MYMFTFLYICLQVTTTKLKKHYNGKYSFTYILSLWFYNPHKTLKIKDRKFTDLHGRNVRHTKGSSSYLNH